jgi:hypothetical protein
MRTMKTMLSRIGFGLFLLAIINFAAFAIGSLVLGGDALNGKVENGTYYVAHRGTHAEVSQVAWWYSYTHAISVFVTHPLGIIGGTTLTRWGHPNS